eukprot:3818843-Pyramimonas_sp.AAC.3
MSMSRLLNASHGTWASSRQGAVHRAITMPTSCLELGLLLQKGSEGCASASRATAKAGADAHCKPHGGQHSLLGTLLRRECHFSERNYSATFICERCLACKLTSKGEEGEEGRGERKEKEEEEEEKEGRRGGGKLGGGGGKAGRIGG